MRTGLPLSRATLQMVENCSSRRCPAPTLPGLMRYLSSVFAKSGDAEGDVLFKRNAKLFGAFADILAGDAFGKELVFEAALHRVNLKIENAFRRTHISASGEKAGNLVAGEQRVLQRGLPRHVGVIRMREDGADDLLGVTLLAQDFCAFGGMPLIGEVLLIGPAFVVEVVQQRSDAPKLLVGAGFTRVGANARFDRQHVFAQVLGRSVFTEKFPGVLAARHSIPPRKGDSLP